MINKINLGILSHNRPNKQITIKHLPKDIVKKAFVFIEPDDNYNIYSKNCEPATVIQFKEKSKNFTQAKNRAIKFFVDKGKRYIFIADDDIIFMIRDRETESGFPALRRCSNEEIYNMFEVLYKVLQIKRLSEVGVTYKQTNWCYREDVILARRISAFMGIDFKETGYFDENCTIFENHEMALKLLTNNKYTALFTKWAMAIPTMSLAEGGVEIYHDREKFKKEAIAITNYLMKKYPELVTSQKKKNKDYIEPKEFWGRHLLNDKAEFLDQIQQILQE